jgi:hypothetical protein
MALITYVAYRKIITKNDDQEENPNKWTKKYSATDDFDRKDQQ